MTAEPTSFETYLRSMALDPATLDAFLEMGGPSAARSDRYTGLQFDPVTGHVPGPSLFTDGIGGCSTISTFAGTGARAGHVYTDRPCRINTYGNSFVQCNQASDGETWQEYLAGHLGEPIRNFGVGGFGVYQAYRRMIREELTDNGAGHVVLYLWGDDHPRSMMRCWFFFWSNIEMDMTSGRLEERENPLSTPESVYRMADPDWIAASLKDDLALNMDIYAAGVVNDLDVPAVRKLGAHLDFDLGSLSGAQPEPGVIGTLLDRYSMATTRLILTKARDFTDQHDKKLLVVLLDPVRVVKSLVQGKPRWDQEIVDFLDQEGFRYFDMNLVHADDYGCFTIPFERYMDRYFALRVPFEQHGDRYLEGHYGPAGNHFFAYSIAPAIVGWLDPKPITYQEAPERWTTFETYWRRS